MAPPRKTTPKELGDARTFCAQHPDGERSTLNGKILDLMISNPTWSLTRIAQGVGCGRTHVVDVQRIVGSGEFRKLVEPHKLRSEPLLTASQRDELRNLLLVKPMCAKDIADWYKNLTGRDVKLQTVYGWCRSLKHSLRAAKRALLPARKPSPRRARTELQISSDEKAALEKKLVDLTATAKQRFWRWDESTPNNALERIRSVLLVACTTKSIRSIAERFKVRPKDVRRWVGYYKHGGLNELCTMNRGGRPRFKHPTAADKT